LCQGLTGSALLGVGYALAKAGFLLAGGDDDKEGKYDKALGNQDFSIKIGGHTYTISWLSPVAMPLLEGASLFKQLEDKENWDANIILDTLAQTLDPLSSMSFLSSLTDTLNSYSKGSAGMIKDIGLNTTQSYVMQFFPTLFSQIASTLDDKKRSTIPSKDSSFAFGEKIVRQIMYKTPGLRNKLESTTDIWGNEKQQAENILQRAFESFLAPYSRSKDLSTELDNELKRVYKETDNTRAIPSTPRSYLMYGGEKYSMSAKDYTQYKETYGQTANGYLSELIKNDTYQNADSETQVKMIDKAFTFSRVQANEEYFENNNYEYSNTYLNELNRIDAENMTNEEMADYIASKKYRSS